MTNFSIYDIVVMAMLTAGKTVIAAVFARNLCYQIYNL